MSRFLSPGQRALLQQLLQMRLHELERRATLRAGDATTDAGDPLAPPQQDGGDAARQAIDRELALARAELDRAEIAAVRDALARVHDAGFGQCTDCGSTIVFDRLKLEPWAPRCVACEAARERRSGSVIPRPTL
jgi:DnaK suppressor protein